MAIPTVDLMEIMPQFIKDYIFVVLLTGDVILAGFVTLATGSNFSGIIGSIFSFVFGSLLFLIFQTPVSVVVNSWQILFMVFLFQFGIFRLLVNLLLAQFNDNPTTHR